MDAADRAATVVVVEDDADLRDLISAVLAASPRLEVSAEAADGTTALARCEELQPDVVVLDLGLPDLAGREVLSGLREVVPGLRVVVYTGGSHSRSTVTEWGAAELVRKDHELDQLVAAVERVADESHRAELDLDRRLESSSAARRFVASTLDEWGCDAVLDEAQLIVSELVTNAVTHAGSDCRLVMNLHPGRLRLEVSDRGDGSPEPQAIDLERSSGRGLLLVSAMASSWGIDPLDGGKIVWAELRV